MIRTVIDVSTADPNTVGLSASSLRIMHDHYTRTADILQVY